jgi:hypothetical protein
MGHEKCLEKQCKKENQCVYSFTGPSVACVTTQKQKILSLQIITNDYF